MAVLDKRPVLWLTCCDELRLKPARRNPGGFLLACLPAFQHHQRMKRTALCIAIALPVSGCGDVADNISTNQACMSASTYVEAYGTPDNRGPCWRRTTAHSVGFGMRSYTVEGARGIAILTYQGNRLVAATEAGRL